MSFAQVIGLPRWHCGKESTYNAEDVDSTPGLGRSLQKEITTYSSILAWEIPWTEGPSSLQSMGSQKHQTGFSD